MIDHRRNVMPGTRYFFTVTPADRASRLWIRIAYLCVGFRVMRLDSRVSQTALNPDYNDYFDAYDERGHLIGEYNASGSAIQETVYLGNQPVAVLKQNNLYTIHTDHLNTPRAISDSNGAVVWRWDSDPFGITPADDDPDMNGVQFTYNLRFPGQYFDNETGLHYNYFRDYDPATGRYIQSDPIGLAGGTNTYAYVGGDPVSRADPLGLFFTPETIWDVGNVIWDIAHEEWEDAAWDAAAMCIPGVSAGMTKVVKKARNKPPAPLPDAQGRPHSIIERPGRDGQYTTYDGNGNWKQYRGSGQDHGGIPRPNVKESTTNVSPDGTVYPGKPVVRPPNPSEIPR